MANRGVKIRRGKITDLIGLYEKAYKDVVITIIGASEAGKINKARTMATIRAQLTELGVNVDEWVKKEIPQYYLDGANHALQDLKALGVEISGPKGLVPINKAAIASLTDETSLAFAQGLTGVARNAQVILGNAYRQQLNFIIADGSLKGDALKTVASNVKTKIEDSGLTAIKDRAGRDWSFDRYAEMLVRTKAVESRNAGLADKMLQNGYDLVQVSDHSSDHQACADWEGEILSITGNTPGYPTTDDAEASGLMHPNCEHAYNPIEPDLADLTSAYDNPYNYDDVGENPGDPPDF